MGHEGCLHVKCTYVHLGHAKKVCKYQTRNTRIWLELEMRKNRSIKMLLDWIIAQNDDYNKDCPSLNVWVGNLMYDVIMIQH